MFCYFYRYNSVIRRTSSTIVTFEYLYMSYKEKSKNENLLCGSVIVKHLTNPNTAGLQLSAESVTLTELIWAHSAEYS